MTSKGTAAADHIQHRCQALLHIPNKLCIQPLVSDQIHQPTMASFPILAYIHKLSFETFAKSSVDAGQEGQPDILPGLSLN